MRHIALLCSVCTLAVAVGAAGFAAARSGVPDAPPAPHEFGSSAPDASYGSFGANMRIAREERLATEYRVLTIALSGNRVILYHFLKTLQQGENISDSEKERLFVLAALGKSQSVRASRLLTQLRGEIETRVQQHCTTGAAHTTDCHRAERDARVWRRDTPDAFAQHGVVFGYAQMLERLLAEQEHITYGGTQ